MSKYKKIILPLLCVLLLCTLFAACNSEPASSDGEESGTSALTTTASEEVAEPVTETKESDPEIEPVTEPLVPDTEPVTEPTTEAEPETTAEPETEAVTEAETEAPKAQNVGAYINPLTGLKTEKDYSNRRPAAIMINNEKSSLPQVGISQADVIYECLTEGGITRLLMLVSDYESLPTVGSVRSARDYYIDFAQNHDAIYVHAGGSTYAYEQIQSRGINNLDGVNMYLPNNAYFRDPERLKTMLYEHCLMTNGSGITNSIAFKKYRTEVKQNFNNPFVFSEKEVVPATGDAKHVIITYNSGQFPQFIYNSATKTYKRWQLRGEAHIDGATGEQLEVTNLLILVCDHGSYNDDYGRITVDTTGTGTGYYVYGGKYMPIKWSKATRDSQISFTDTKGNQLKINPGKTFVSIISPYVEDTLQLNYTR